MYSLTVSTSSGELEFLNTAWNVWRMDVRVDGSREDLKMAGREVGEICYKDIVI